MAKSAASDIIGDTLPTVSHGEGCYLFDTRGKRYIDGSGGPAVFSLGHAHPEVNDAIKQQLERIAHGYRYTFTSDPLLRLNECIHAQTDNGFEHILYVSSGSEATESALKIALQYHWTQGEKSRTRFIARERSYHGNTLGALSVSGFAQRRKQFEGSLLPCSFVSPANTYRPAAPGGEAALTNFLVHELQQTIEELGPENVAAFIFEPVVGAAGGVVSAPAGYARGVREVCESYGVLLIADEVMCGSGRCGNWRALEHEQVLPDIMTIAKGLGGGYIPLGAVLYSQRIGEPIHSQDGGPNSGHTFTGHTLACAAAAKVQEIVIRDQLVEQVRIRGLQLLSNLASSIGHLDAVGDIRGRGYFVGVELVADRNTNQAFDPALRLTEILRARTLEAGLVCYPVNGTIDGVHGDVAIIAPPYIATPAQLDEIVGLFAMGLQRALRDIGKA